MARTIQLQLWLWDLLQFRESAIALHVEGFDVLAEEKHRVGMPGMDHDVSLLNT